MSDINDVFGNEESGFEAVFGGSFPGDYNDLSNKPSIESQELVGNKTAEDLGLAKASDIPVNVSELNNDADYQTETEVASAVNSINPLITVSKTNNFAATIFGCAEHGETKITIKGASSAGDVDKIIVRWATALPTQTADLINIGLGTNSTEPIRKVAGKAINSSGQVVDDASSTIYVFPIEGMHKYIVPNGYVVTDAWASTSAAFSDDYASMTKITYDAVFDNISLYRKIVFSTTSDWIAFTIFDVTKNPTPGTAWDPAQFINTEYRWVIPNCTKQPQYIRKCGMEITNGVPKFINGTNGTQFVVDLSDITWNSKSDGIITGVLPFAVNASYTASTDLTRKTSESQMNSTNNSYWINSTSSTHMDIKIHINDYASMTLDEAIAAMATAGKTIAMQCYDNTAVEVTYTQPVVAGMNAEPITTKKGPNYYACNFPDFAIQYQRDITKAIENAYTIPDVPTTNGTYTLKCTKSGSVFTYSWVKDT